MLKFIFAIIFFISPVVKAEAPSSWRSFMSQPHVQGDDGLCPVYAAVHCMEGLYNYYYELHTQLHIGEYVFIGDKSPIYGESSLEVFNKIKAVRVSPVDENWYPNLAHSFFAVSAAGEIPSKHDGRFTHDNLLDNIKQNIDNWGPICLYIWDYPVIKQVVENWEPGDFPVQHVVQPGLGVDFHWVVVVDYGKDYLECFNSYPTGDDHFFKINTEYFDTWAFHAVWASLHISSAIDYDTISAPDPNLNFYYAPKIYPYMNKYFVAYNENGTPKVYPDISMDFFGEGEQVYLLGNVETYSQ